MGFHDLHLYKSGDAYLPGFIWFVFQWRSPLARAILQRANSPFESLDAQVAGTIMKLALDKQAAKKTPLLKIFRKVNPNGAAAAGDEGEREGPAKENSKKSGNSASAKVRAEPDTRAKEKKESASTSTPASSAISNLASTAISNSVAAAMSEPADAEMVDGNMGQESGSGSKVGEKLPVASLAVQRISPDALPQNRKRKSHVVALTALDLPSATIKLKSPRVICPVQQAPNRPLQLTLQDEEEEDEEESASSKVAVANALLFLSS